MKLIVISKEKVFDGEPLWINALMEKYDFTFHLRKPGLTERETEEIILQINSNFHNRIVLHDHFTLAAKYRLKGVHLNSRNPEANFKHGCLDCLGRHRHRTQQCYQRFSQRTPFYGTDDQRP